MPRRRSDVIEVIGERALTVGLGGVFIAGFGFLLWFYRNYQGGEFLAPLGMVLMTIGVLMVLFAAWSSTQVRQVQSFDVICPFCDTRNVLTERPENDFNCVNCARMIPIEDGKPMEVQQVRCGYCNELNFYSEKNDVLICEKCDREIPLATRDGQPSRHIPKAYAVTDDDRLYELVLTGYERHKQEDLINALQHMLAQNRNMVKLMLDELPVTLLTGIPKKKAEMLQAQLAIHDGAAEARPMGQ